MTVFTAAYEIGSGIGTAFRSLVHQTYPNWEWVVVDDSVGDDTEAHLRELLASDDAAGRVRLLRQHPHTGSIGANKATAAGVARGVHLVELDHDDELAPEALEIVVATFATHPDIDFLFSDWVDWIGAERSGEAAASGRFADGWGFGFGAYASERVAGRRVDVGQAPPLEWRTIRHIVAAPNHLRAWRRDAYQRIGGHDPELDVADDFELVVRTFLDGHTARLPRPLYVQHHTVAETNTSRVRNARIQDLVEVTATRYRGDLDHRLTALGRRPDLDRPDPLTDDRPLPAANATIDVVAEAAADVGSPLVSVVIPTFRRPDLLRSAIASVLAQTYPHLEVLVVGDGCDAVEGVVAELDDHRIRCANLRRNHADGGASPRNFALKVLARGTLIAYLDDDNTWAPTHLESLVALLDDPAISYAFSSFTLGGETVICRRPVRFQIDTSAIVHRRGLLDHHGYWSPPDRVGYAHDWELVSRWQGEPWAASGQATLHYRAETTGHGLAALPLILDAAAREEARERGAPATDVDVVTDADTEARPAAPPDPGPVSEPAVGPRIAVYGIARNEAAQVERWAASAAGADHIVLVDTGSTDATVAEARRVGVEVQEIRVDPWRFDHARNRALALVPDAVDLCISLDLDEVLAPGWRDRLTEVWRPDVTRVRFDRSWTWDPGQPVHRYRDDRIHARAGYRWAHPVHEDLVAAGTEVVVDSDVEIVHHRDGGATRPGYLDLLHLAVEEAPEDGRLAHMLANEYRMRSMPDDARTWAHRALRLPLPVDELAHTLLQLAWLDPDEAETLIVAACRAAPDRREPWCELARHHQRAGRWRASLGAVRAALEVRTPARHYLENPYAWAQWPHQLGARAAEHLGDLDAAVRFARAAHRAAPGDEAIAAELERLVHRLRSPRIDQPGSTGPTLTGGGSTTTPRSSRA